VLRELVVSRCDGAGRIADLFCGLGNFTFALNADGFDIVGTGMKRDLFKKPLTVGMLNNYDCVVMDPPRAGAMTQCCELVRSNVPRIIYVSCNPQTFMRDMEILIRGGYKNTELIPVDQFAGSQHWELFGVFEK
jgi:23S rRNA (uracil1939-C5)-methyltransferase